MHSVKVGKEEVDAEIHGIEVNDFETEVTADYDSNHQSGIIQVQSIGRKQ